MIENQSPRNKHRVFITDCEGPISKNDNAFELTRYCIPEGDTFFALLSKYDDVLADVVKKPGYKAGDTLRLILPFLRVYGATNHKLREYSSQNILLVPGAQETLCFVRNLMPSFIISTSYECYVSQLCDLVSFPSNNVYCTRLDLDKYRVCEDEDKRLREFRREISTMPPIEIPENAKSLQDFSERDRETIHRLDEIFWEDILSMELGKMLVEVDPVGGSEKAKAVQDIVDKIGSSLSNVIFVGDSITDVPPLHLVRKNGGLAVSFNGNRYAIREAEVAVLSAHTSVTSVLAEAFNNFGKEFVLRLIAEWSPHGLHKFYVNPKLSNLMLELYPHTFPKVETITKYNRERLIKESSAFRKKVRGGAIGKLG